MAPEEQIVNFQTVHPQQTKAFYLSKADIDALYALSNAVDGVRIYLAQDEGSNKFSAFANACSGQKDFLPPSTGRKSMLPCPTYCS